MNLCSIIGCNRPAKTRGWCRLHYTRWKIHGDPLKSLRPHHDTEACYGLKVIQWGSDDCWGWNGALSTSGYPQLRINNRVVYAHRWIYEKYYGPIPDGYDIDHICHNADSTCLGGHDCAHRKCTNPKHLEAVPHRVNVLRSQVSIPAINSKKTVCPKGHPYKLLSNGSRYCPICNLANKVARGETSGLGRAKYGPESKTHCPSGHPFDKENTGYKKVKNAYFSRYCKACARKRAKEYYDLFGRDKRRKNKS